MTISLNVTSQRCLRALAVFSAIVSVNISNAHAASCVSPGCVTVDELMNGGSFQSNGFTFSDFDFLSGLPADYEFHVYPPTSGQAAGPYWANGGFSISGPGRSPFVSLDLAPGSNVGVTFEYKVRAPASADGTAVIFDRALLATSGVSFTGGRNSTYVGFVEQIQRLNGGLLAENHLADQFREPTGSSEVALGQFLAAGLTVVTSFSATVGNDTQGDSGIVIDYLIERFDAKTVPEPTSMMLSALGLSVLGLLSRRRRVM